MPNQKEIYTRQSTVSANMQHVPEDGMKYYVADKYKTKWRVQRDID